MPFIVAHAVVSLLRPRAYTKKHVDPTKQRDEFIIEQPEFADQFGVVGKTDEAATSIEECSPLLQRTFPARFIAPCLPTKTDPPRLRQTGIHFILTPRTQTGDHGQPQRPGRLGRDFGGRFILGGNASWGRCD
jgi:hypothetical protein